MTLNNPNVFLTSVLMQGGMGLLSGTVLDSLFTTKAPVGSVQEGGETVLQLVLCDVSSMISQDFQKR
jgi:hypothetical protein